MLEVASVSAHPSTPFTARIGTDSTCMRSFPSRTAAQDGHGSSAQHFSLGAAARQRLDRERSTDIVSALTEIRQSGDVVDLPCPLSTTSIRSSGGIRSTVLPGAELFVHRRWRQAYRTVRNLVGRHGAGG